MTSLVIIGLIGVTGGVLAGLFGVGGGVLFVPARALVLGLTQLHAEASSLLAIIPTALVGSFKQHRYGNIDLRVATFVGVASIAGVEGGVQLAESLPESVLKRLFGILLVLIAVQILWRTRRRSGTLPG
jgi:hypothetical protein